MPCVRIVHLPPAALVSTVRYQDLERPRMVPDTFAVHLLHSKGGLACLGELDVGHTLRLVSHFVLQHPDLLDASVDLECLLELILGD